MEIMDSLYGELEGMSVPVFKIAEVIVLYTRYRCNNPGLNIFMLLF